MNPEWQVVWPPLAGALCLGISAGLLGCFLVARRLSLLGDTLSHSLLPGIAVGFLIASGREMPWLLGGAMVSGLLSVWVVSMIRETTRLKEDVQLGLVLSGFYAAGAVLFTWIQRLPLGGKGGLNGFLFGQVAAVDAGDLWLLGGLTLLTIGFVAILYKELLTSSFDPVFAHSIGIPPALMHPLLMTFVAVAVVVAVEKVGVVMVSALLILPAVTARLLTYRFHWLLLISVLVGSTAAICGVLLSLTRPGMPLGPLIVLSAGAMLLLALLFSPRHGIGSRLWRQTAHRNRIRTENALKWIYLAQEERADGDHPVRVREVAARANQGIAYTEHELHRLQRKSFLHWGSDEDQGRGGERALTLSEEGERAAARVIRNHRLWERYLTDRAAFLSDHVHESAEFMEHELPEEVAQRLTEILQDPGVDPHGKPIPRAEERPPS